MTFNLPQPSEPAGMQITADISLPLLGLLLRAGLFEAIYIAPSQSVAFCVLVEQTNLKILKRMDLK